MYNEIYKDDPPTRKLIGTTLPNIILSKWGKVAVLAITSAMMSVGLYGSNYLFISYTPFLLIPADSYVHESRQVMHDYFPWILEENYVCVQFQGDFDYSTSQKELVEVEDYVCSLAARDECFAWYSLFRFYVMTKYNSNLADVITEDGFVRPDLFYSELAEYSKDTSMAGVYVAQQYLKWKTDTELYGSEYCFMWQQEYDVPKEIKWMQDVRAKLIELAPAFQPRLFTGYFFAIEPLATIVPDTLSNFALILTVVIVVCLLVLANVRATVLVLTAVMAIEMMVIGSLHFFDLQFNMMSSIMLIVGVGLCVDFSAHTTHAFLHSTKITPHGKARDALRNVGLSIWNGAFSSIAAMLPMCLCKSYMVLTWWRMITLVVALGIWFGLIVIPVLLTLFDDFDEEYSKGDYGEISENREIEISFDMGRIKEEEGENENDSDGDFGGDEGGWTGVRTSSDSGGGDIEMRESGALRAL
jgi:predicted RND superfamily exporter protein